MSNIQQFKNKFNKNNNTLSPLQIQQKNDFLNNEHNRINNEINEQNNNIIIKNNNDIIDEKNNNLKNMQEKLLEDKLKKWILEENKGEDELLQFLNGSPEQFEHVDNLFFHSNMNHLFQVQKTQRDLKKIEYDNAYKHKNTLKNNNPRARFSMKLF